MIIVNLMAYKQHDGTLKGSITGSVNGKTYGVKYTKDKYEAMLALSKKAETAASVEDLQNIVADFEPYTKDGYKELIETACPNILVNEETGKHYLKTADGVTVSNKELPAILVARIMKSVELGIDFMPIVKMWTRWLRMFELRGIPYDYEKSNKFANYISKTTIDQDLVEELTKNKGVSYITACNRATVYQTPITQEGLICTLKYSTEVTTKFDQDGKIVPRYQSTVDPDTGERTTSIPEEVEDRLFMPAIQGDHGDPFYCYMLSEASKKPKPGHFIRVGRLHELEDWSKVDCNDDHTCVKGLHTGGTSYVQNFAGPGRVLHNVFVSPEHVGAIDRESDALRVLKYYVHSSNVGINRSIYHSSTYAAHTDLEWEDMRKSAIEATNKAKQEADENQAIVNAL